MSHVSLACVGVDWVVASIEDGLLYVLTKLWCRHSLEVGLSNIVERGMLKPSWLRVQISSSFHSTQLTGQERSLRTRACILRWSILPVFSTRQQSDIRPTQNSFYPKLSLLEERSFDLPSPQPPSSSTRDLAQWWVVVPVREMHHLSIGGAWRNGPRPTIRVAYPRRPHRRWRVLSRCLQQWASIWPRTLPCGWCLSFLRCGELRLLRREALCSHTDWNPWEVRSRPSSIAWWNQRQWAGAQSHGFWRRWHYGTKHPLTANGRVMQV